MSTPASSRKRNAPGAVPTPQMQNMAQLPMMPQSFNATTQGQQFWNGNGNGLDMNNMANMDTLNNNVYNGMQTPQAQGYQQHVLQQVQQIQQQFPATPVQQQLAQPDFSDQHLTPGTHNMLARVDHSRRAVTAARGPSAIPGQLDGGSYTPTAAQNMQPGPHQAQDESEIDRRAAKAHSGDPNRKIAPFVLKLQKFLDDNERPDLIGWSQDGKSIMIFDEENFAKLQLPKLFKHSNFASFVRQLNMYGFHKHVSLGQNSMRASESKQKSVHEYWNPYFRKDKPNWLCLISKAGKAATKKITKSGRKQRQAEAVEVSDDEDEVEAIDDDEEIDQPAVGSSSRDLVPIPKNLATVQREIRLIKQNQDAIQAQIAALKEEYGRDRTQAQLMHQRTDNSINAILAFLANVFKQSLEGGDHSRAQFQEAIANMLSNAGAGQVPQGTVVDLGGFAQENIPNSRSPHRRVQHLLPAPPSASDNATAGRNMYSSAQASPSIPYQHGYQQGTVEEITGETPTDTSSPADLRNQLRQNPQPTMMNIINNHNATTNSSRTALTRSPTPRFRQASPVNPVAGQSPRGFTPPVGFPRVPTPVNFEDHQGRLNGIGRLQQEQVDRIGSVMDQLGPVSPEGQIQGVGENFFGDAADFNTSADYNFDVSDYINDNDSIFDASRPNFTSGGMADDDQHDQFQGLAVSQAPTLNIQGLIQSPVQTPIRPSQLSQNSPTASFMLDEYGEPLNNDGLAAVIARSSGGYGGTPSPANTEEITRDDLDDGSPGHGSSKRRRVA